MVLVDTTVWIDFFDDRKKPPVAALQQAIENEEDLCICGVILAEVLQGIRSDADYIETKIYLEDLIYLPMWQKTYVSAAEVYRSLRKRGVTIRKPVDCMIASVALENDTWLLHNDRDFNQIAKHTNLKIYE